MTDTGGHLTTVPEITGKPKLDPVSVATPRHRSELEIDAPLDKVVARA